MDTHTDAVRLQLTRGPQTSRQLTEKIEISQPSLSRVLGTMAAEVVRVGAARSIQQVNPEQCLKLIAPLAIKSLINIKFIRLTWA